MKNLLLIFSILILAFTISCDKYGCGGGRNATSEPNYPFDIYYLDKSSGENLLGMDVQTIADNEVMAWLLEGDSLRSIYVGLNTNREMGHHIGISSYEGHQDQVFIIKVADFPPDTIVMDYDRGEEKVQLWYKDELLVNRDKCDWEVPQVISYQ